MAITSATTKQLSDGNSVGTQLGQSTSDKISFYAATPIAQPTSTWQAAVLATSAAGGGAVSTPTGANTVWGYSTAAVANSIVTLVNELRAEMVALGLIKGS